MQQDQQSSFLWHVAIVASSFALIVVGAAIGAPGQASRPVNARVATRPASSPGPTSAPATRPALRPAPDGTARISRSEYGEAWPFTVAEGVLRGIALGGPLVEVSFTANGVTYAVNGVARSNKKYHPLEDIWVKDPHLPIARINIGPIIDRGLKLARGIDEPYFAPLPPPRPAELEKATLRCDLFNPRVKLSPGAGTDTTVRRLSVILETDLPDTTQLIVTVGRNVLNAVDKQEYQIDYFQERTTVGAWRKERVIDLNHDNWQAALEKRLKFLAAAQEPFQVQSLNSRIIVSFTVHVSQDDPRFSGQNANLKGKAVTKTPFGNVVRKELGFGWPVKRN